MHPGNYSTDHMRNLQSSDFGITSDEEMTDFIQLMFSDFKLVRSRSAWWATPIPTVFGFGFT